MNELVIELGTPSSARSRTRTVARAGHGRVRIREDGLWSSFGTPNFVGIEVVKDRLDMHLRPSGEASLGRDDAGLAALVVRLGHLAPALVMLQATGAAPPAADGGAARS